MRNATPFLLLLLTLAAGCHDRPAATRPVTLLNVSYDPTRELYTDINAAFSGKQPATKPIEVSQSHGGSSSQARAVSDGLEADVVTLALPSDIDSIRQRGLIAADWEERLPNRSMPYFSTIVFIVRKGNPKSIRDWPDLVKEGVKVITPNPKTGGGAKLNFLAAWLSVTSHGGSDEQAQAFVTELYRHVPVLDSGARGAATTFAQKKIGDAQIAWENEAYREVAALPDELEIVNPSVTLRAEPKVAVVDAVVDRRGTRAAATEYLQFLYTPAAQEIIAGHYFRPIDAEVWGRHKERFPQVRMLDITAVAADWNAAFERFFANGGVYDEIAADTAPAKE